MQAMFNCNIKLECKEPSGKQNRLQHYTHSHHLQEQDRPLGIFKSCIHSLRIHIVCFDHTHPLLPTSLTSTLFPSTQLLSSFFTQVQFVLPTYSWVCGLPLECIYFLGATLWKKNLFSFSQRLSVANSSWTRDGLHVSLRSLCWDLACHELA